VLQSRLATLLLLTILAGFFARGEREG
jgi:hypothetical protein